MIRIEGVAWPPSQHTPGHLPGGTLRGVEAPPACSLSPLERCVGGRA
ncbi:hypothetical protein ATSB10_27100 [Dyella thiooxydans]|uniref:Uncharacterized protein n=1 Tax=Dyella thiooxydans TaxID=445710 RepID=A0A160N3B6_9GAMM|nr:hypothetical protein ATSB10_27100 [Dyella thiooxydans]